MGVYNSWLFCLLSAIPGIPPGIRFEDAYLQLFPIDKTACHDIDPIRDIQYQLFTRVNPIQYDVLILGNDEALFKSHMNFSNPTVLYYHAFFETSTAPSAIAMRTGYLLRKRYNIILLHAPRVEAGPWYITAARNTRVVGEYTAKFIDYLVSKGLYLPSLHLVGLSLGAQMAGVTGRNLKSGRIARITGLDPAKPLFTKWPKSLKLDRSDAQFVDVIHSDAGIFGYPIPVGHVDFWPNQGISPQPGCLISDVRRRNPDAVTEKFFCSHWRSYQFYAESIVNEHGFLATNCPNWNDYVRGKCNNSRIVNMGYGLLNSGKISPGNYYLRTNPESPYSMN